MDKVKKFVSSRLHIGVGAFALVHTLSDNRGKQ